MIGRTAHRPDLPYILLVLWLPTHYHRWQLWALHLLQISKWSNARQWFGHWWPCVSLSSIGPSLCRIRTPWWFCHISLCLKSWVHPVARFPGVFQGGRFCRWSVCPRVCSPNPWAKSTSRWLTWSYRTCSLIFWDRTPFWSRQTSKGTSSQSQILSLRCISLCARGTRLPITSLSRSQKQVRCNSCNQWMEHRFQKSRSIFAWPAVGTS